MKLMDNRVRDKSLNKKICTADQAADLIKDSMTIGCSGFTPSGYPKAVPAALAERIKSSGQDCNITLLTGASVGCELDGQLAKAGIIKRRFPYQSDANLRTGINSGYTAYKDIHLSHFPQEIRYGYYGTIDYAIIEAAQITKEGNIIPTTSVGISPTLASEAENIIVEINMNKPVELKGYHDIYQPEDPPHRKPLPLYKVNDRIGNHYIEVADDKIAAIVITDQKDDICLSVFQNETSQYIADNIIDFFSKEVKKNNLPKNLLPLQSGVGSIANAVLSGLKNSSFGKLSFYSEVIQDAVFDLIDCGKIKIASGTSITLSPEAYQNFIEKIDYYKDKIILRPQEISNSPEIIRRLGSIAINTALEIDIYGNVNSTHLMGTNMVNGIGGSGDFTRNAYLSIFVTPSTAKDGHISTIVPMVSHTDHTEHDVDLIVTEQGKADLRGLSPRERALEIINNCAHPNYRKKLKEYYNKAKRKGGHTPHNLEDAFSWHQSFLDKKTMHDI